MIKSEKHLEDMLVKALKREDYYEFFKERGLNLSPLKSGEKPAGDLHIHRQPLLDVFGRADLILSWKRAIMILELKVEPIKSKCVAQLLRYKSVVKKWYPHHAVDAIVLSTELYNIGHASDFDPYFLIPELGLKDGIVYFDEDGLSFNCSLFGRADADYMSGKLKEFKIFPENYSEHRQFRPNNNLEESTD